MSASSSIAGASPNRRRRRRWIRSLAAGWPRGGAAARSNHKDARPSLIELIDVCGLAEVLRVEVQRLAEQREDPRRVEEKGELGDPAL